MNFYSFYSNFVKTFFTVIFFYFSFLEVILDSLAQPKKKIEQKKKATKAHKKSINYLQRKSSMCRLSAATTLTNMWIILSKCFILQYFELCVQSAATATTAMSEAAAGASTKNHRQMSD